MICLTTSVPWLVFYALANLHFVGLWMSFGTSLQKSTGFWKVRCRNRLWKIVTLNLRPSYFVSFGHSTTDFFLRILNSPEKYCELDWNFVKPRQILSAANSLLYFVHFVHAQPAQNDVSAWVCVVCVEVWSFSSLSMTSQCSHLAIQRIADIGLARFNLADLARLEGSISCVHQYMFTGTGK